MGIWHALTYLRQSVVGSDAEQLRIDLHRIECLAHDMPSDVTHVLSVNLVDSCSSLFIELRSRSRVGNRLLVHTTVIQNKNKNKKGLSL